MALIVASIDFGTAQSGWCFSSKNDFKQNPTHVSAKQWNAAPTCILLNQNMKVIAFGYEAETKFAELAKDKKHADGYYYFKKFKMVLYNQKAGIPDERLSLALEPEAASLYCRHIPVEKSGEPVGKSGSAEMSSGTDEMSDEVKMSAVNDGAVVSSFKPGRVYMVVDAGGGTADITVHEVAKGGKLKEIHTVSGGPWGATKVDEAFCKLLDDLLGKGILSKLKMENMDDYITLLRDFEFKKREIDYDEGHITIRIPFSLIELVQRNGHAGILEAIQASPYAHDNDIKTADKDKIRVGKTLARRVLFESVKQMCTHVQGILDKPELKCCSAILLVGGFSESPVLQSDFRKSFSKYNILIPDNPGMTVMKGAVVFGHRSKDIQSRVVQYTYGLKVYKDFDPALHPFERKTKASNGKEKARGCFDKIIEIGQSASSERPVVSRSLQPTGDFKSFDVKLYASTDKNPQYVDQPNCFLMGEFSVNCQTSEGKVGSATVGLIFGDTELKVTAKRDDTGEETTKLYYYNFDC
ncbi:HS12A-like protein [Mya arenaria]|uniref:HS12A-like protein n=1 Tax=Mya arenaria TaxID=6604 RepID=A0ABY7EZX6_MYAAR|nr:HS12A-like protein [Mya arenaria]